MKKFYFIALLVSVGVFGQNCKYKKNEIDEFTKKKVLVTNDSYLSASTSFFTMATAKKVGESRFLSVFFSKVGGTFVVQEEADFMLLDDKGDMITLKIPDTEISGTKISSIARTNTVTIDFPLSDDNYTKLISSKITKVRIYTTDGYIDNPVKEKYWKKVLEQLKCIR